MNKDSEAWGRHYDTLLWTVTTIMGVAIGGLLVYLHNNFDLWLAVSGLILTILAIYFAASFRELRHEIECHYGNKKVLEARVNRKFHQWWAYVLIFIIIELLWIKLLVDNSPAFLLLWILMGIGGLVLIFYFSYERNDNK